MNKKKLLALLMALVMTLSLLPVTAFADEMDTQPVSNSANVAKIGTIEYPTLADAIAAANASGNCTITILQDVDFSSEDLVGYKWAGSTFNPLRISKTGVTLNLNGHRFYNMGNCAIEFGSIFSKDGTIASAAITNGTLQAGQTNGATNSYVLLLGGVDNVTISNITTNGGINACAGTNATISDCVVNGTKYYAVCAQTGSDVTIKNSTITKNTSSVESKAMFWVQGAGTDSDCVTDDNSTGAFGASAITIKSGRYTVDSANGGEFYLAGGIEPVVEGGTFNIDPSSYVAAGCEAVNNGNGTWTVVSANANTAVAQIGNVKYATLQAAFDNVENGQTIELLKDIDLSDWTPIGTIDTINGSNGAPSGHTSFSGTLDGKNHTITGLTANLFNSLNDATIKDLKIDGATIHGGDCVGALAGYAYNSTISNVTVTGALDITGKHFVGGVVGYAARTTMDDVDVNATGAISATDSTGEDGDDVGGVVGYFGPSATLVNCDVNGSGQLTISADRQAGGLAGISSAAGAITNCSVRNVTVQCTTNDYTSTKKNTKIAFGGLVSSFNTSSCGAVTGCTVSNVTLEAAENANTTNARVGIISAGRYIKSETNALPSISATASNNTLEISSESELKSICDEVNRGVNYAGNTVNLTSDITLQSDIALNVTVNITKDLTIDLNDHNITATNVRALWVKSGNVTITGQGKISASGDTLSASSSVIRVGDGSKDSSPRAKASLTIGPNVTVESDKCYGVSVFGVNNTGLELTVNGTINVTGEGGAVANNGNSWNTATTMTINGTVTSENSYAIYHPGKGELTVTGNGIVIGYGGIEVKSGTVIIDNGATVKATATADELYHEKNNNGASTKGYAIAAVSNTGYVGDPTVIINSNGVIGQVIMLVDGNADLNAIVKANDNYVSILSNGFEWKDDDNDGVYVLTEVVDYTAEPTWQWHVINGEWKAIATYKTAAGSSVVQICDGYKTSVTQGTIVYTASNGYSNAPQKVVEQQYHVSYSQDPSQVDQTTYSWGEICTLHADVLSNWFIVEGNKEVKIAAATETYSFAVTGDVVIESVEAIGEEAEPQAIVYATMKSTESGKAEFQTKWSIPKGASVQSVTIYRGYTSTDKTITADTLIAKGTRYDANLNVLNGDFLLRLTGLTSNTYQHAVIVIKYRAGTEVKTLKSDVLNVHVL